MHALKSKDVRARVEPELKASAVKVLDQVGLDLSDAIRLFLRQIVAVNGMPFDVRVPNETTVAAMKEVRAIQKARFKTAKDLFNDLEKTSKRKTR